MATDIERLVVNIDANINKFRNEMQKASGVADSNFRRIERRAASMTTRLNASFTGIGKSMAAAFAGAVTLRNAQEFIDASVRIQNALRSAGLEGEALTKVYGELYASAQKNAAPLESLVTLYSRMALVQKELNASQADLLQFTNTIAMALRAGGISAQEASGALTQLAQALGGGVVHAEEFNSILEGAPTIARAAAFGIAEAGGSVAKLRQLMLDGKISSEAFFRGVQAGAPVLEQQLAGAQRTISQSFQILYNSLTDAAKRFNTSAEAAGTFGRAVENLADFVDGVSFDGLIGQVQGYIDRVSGAIDATNRWIEYISRVSGLENVGAAIADSAVGNAIGAQSTKLIRERMEGNPNADPDGAAALDAYIRQHYGTPSDKGERVAPPKKTFEPVKPISLADYPATGSGRGGGSRGRGGRGGPKQNDYEREIEQITRRTSALQAETAAQAGVNPLVDDYGYALEKARVTHDLLTAAQEAGLKITPELKANIDKLAEGYANATVESAKLQESQDKVRRSAEEWAGLGKDVASGFISDLREGKDAADALAGALQKVGDKLLDMALNSIFTPQTGGGGLGGLLQSAFSLFGFAKGGIAAHGRPLPLPRFAGGGVARSASIFGEAGPEAAVPLPDGRRIPVDLRMPSVPTLPVARRGGAAEVVHIKLRDDSGRMADIADQRIQTHSGEIVRVSVERSAQAVQNNFGTMQATARRRAL